MEETLFRTFLIDIFNENTVVYNLSMKYNQIYAKIFRVVKHLTIYYVLTTFHSPNTPHFALFCQIFDIFNNLSAKYNPRETPQNTANQRNKGGKTTMIKILFICHGTTAEMHCISG